MFAETVLKVVGNMQQKLEWPDYGFYLEVPDGAITEGKTISVVVRAIMAGQFLLPEDSQLVSAIYFISASEMFLKEVAVNIQHFAVIRSEQECSKFKFIIAKCSQKQLPYRFIEKEGVFKPCNQYATIKLKQFSFLGVKSPLHTEIRLVALKFYKQISCTPLTVKFKFVVVPNHGPFVKVNDFLN